MSLDRRIIVHDIKNGVLIEDVTNRRKAGKLNATNASCKYKNYNFMTIDEFEVFGRPDGNNYY